MTFISADNDLYSTPKKARRNKRRKNIDMEIAEVTEEAPPLPPSCLSNEEHQNIQDMEDLFAKYQKSCDDLTDFFNAHFKESRPYTFMHSIVIFRRVLLSLRFQINMVNGCVKLSEEQAVKNKAFKTLVNKTFKKRTVMMDTTKSIRKRNEELNGTKTDAESYLERRAIKAAIQLATEVMECFEDCRMYYDTMDKGGEVVRERRAG